MPSSKHAQDENITVTALSEHIGMQVHDVDLSGSINEAQNRAIDQALADHMILLFRDQNITQQQFVDFSRLFGELEVHVLTQYQVPDHPEIFIVSNVVKGGRNIGTYGGGRWFHSDMSYIEQPPLGSLFYCRQCPPEGGETEFASMFAAYDALPPQRREWLRAQRGVHDYVYHYDHFLTHRAPLTDEQKANLKPTSHPAVRTHPVNGRDAIFLSEALTSHFEGMDLQESRKILKDICDFATQSRFVYRHQWRPGDLIFWDNRSTMHRAMPFDEQKHERLMHRTTVKGDKPFLR